jgi:DhnA family fructose-bisphosphate aldolase class Ia
MVSKIKKMVMIVAFECVTLFAHQYPMLVVLNIYARTHNFETEKKFNYRINKYYKMIG